MLGGLHDSVAHMLAEELEPLGFVATQSSVGGNSKGGPTAFEPGGAVAVELARGDISMTGVGTVTYVGKGGRTLAFGHPMMEAGATGLPTATARVLHVLVSEVRSFKIAEAGQPLGALVQDRQPAIVIDPDIEPARIPVRVKVNGVEGAPKTEWRVDVASHRALTPSIVYAVIANAVKSTAGDVTDVIFRARSQVGIEGHGVISLDEQGFSPMGAASPAVFSQLRMFGLMEAAFANVFESSRVTSIDLELDLERSREVFQVSDATVAYDEVDPGEEVTIYVRLRRVDQPDTIRAVQVRIPTAAAGKTVRVAVAAGNQIAIEQPRPGSLGDLIEQAQRRYPATSLVVALQMPTRGLRFEGHVVDSLPAVRRSSYNKSWSAAPTLRFASVRWDGTSFSASNKTMNISKTTIRIALVGLVLATAASVAAVTTQSFVLDSADAFFEGEFEGAAVRSDGSVRVGAATKRIELEHVPLAYSVAQRGSTTFIGTGTNGVVYRFDGKNVKVFANTGELLVSSLAFGRDGALYAGTLPNGRIYRIDPKSGTMKRFSISLRQEARAADRRNGPRGEGVRDRLGRARQEAPRCGGLPYHDAHRRR
jgi:hypothetical protein